MQAYLRDRSAQTVVQLVPPLLHWLIVSANKIHRLVGLVVKVSTPKAEGPKFESRLRQDFSGSSHTSDLKNWHSSGYPARRLEL